MPNASSITIVGHLARDASTKEVGSTTVTEWSMAVNHKRKGEETTMWFNCAMWGKRGEAVAPYLTKGSAVFAIGRFNVRDYEGKNGPGYALEVDVQELSLLGDGPKREDATPKRDAAPPPPADDDSIPF